MADTTLTNGNFWSTVFTTPITAINDTDSVLVKAASGTTDTIITAALLRAYLQKGITPSIGTDGYWYIGGVLIKDASGNPIQISAEGKTPTIAMKTIGGVKGLYLTYKGSSAEDTDWTLLVTATDLMFTFEDLTDAQKQSFLTYFTDAITKCDEATANAAKATADAVTAAENANDTANHPTKVSDDGYVMIWDKSTQAYNTTTINLIGKPFMPTFFPSTVAACTSDTTQAVGTIAMVISDADTDEDNGKVYIRNTDKWSFIADLSGVQGLRGFTPVLKIGTVTTGAAGTSASSSISATGETDASGNPIFAISFSIPKGDKGDAFTFADFTAEQIAQLQKPATDKIAEMDTAISNANTATSNANNTATALQTTVDELKNYAATYMISGFMRANGDADPAGDVFFGTDEATDAIVSHFVGGLFKDGLLNKKLANARITLATDGSESKIDGTEGDVMMNIDCVMYYLHTTVTVNSVEQNIAALGLSPFELYGKQADRIEPFADCISYPVIGKLGTETVDSWHCVYNTSLVGQYNTPFAYFKQKIKTSGGGYPNQYINSLQNAIYAQNKNTDVNTNKVYMPTFYKYDEVFLTALMLVQKSVNLTSLDSFGVGCTSSDMCSDDTTFASNTIYGNSGVKIFKPDGTSFFTGWFSNNFKETSSGSLSNIIGGISGSSWYGFTECQEPQRVLDTIAANGLIGSIGTSNIFTDGGATVITDGSVVLATGVGMTSGKKYYTVRNIPKFKGMADGVMTALVNIYVKLEFADGVCYTDGTVMTGGSAIFKFSHPVAFRKSLMDGMFENIWGAIYVGHADASGNLSMSFACADSPDDLPVIKSSSTLYGTEDTVLDLEKGMNNILKGLSWTEGWVSKSDYNYSQYVCKATGANIRTYECRYNWQDGIWGQGTNGKPANGYKCVNGVRVRCYALPGFASYRTAYCYCAAGDSYVACAGRFALRYSKTTAQSTATA